MTHRRGPWTSNVEALAMAIVVALLLKYFLVEAYKIPTGSMQPTLIGNDATGIHDRILVDKLSYRLRDPRRFEVVVFRYPLDLSKSFVKRIVGVGPEELRIRHGDLWHRPAGPAGSRLDDGWRILRRPRSVQAETWKRVDRLEPSESSWTPAPAGLPWEMEGRRVVARGSGRARFRSAEGSIMDAYTHGYPDSFADLVRRRRGSGSNPVGDVRVDFEVAALDGTKRIGIELQEGPMRYLLSVPGPAAEEGARVEIRARPVTRFGGPDVPPAVQGPAYRLPAGVPVRVGAQNLDDLVELDVAGEVLASLEIPAAFDQRSSVAIEVEGEGATFDDLMVYRDIYYLGGDEDEWEIPAGHYVMLGDNTQDSSDSREWRFARFRFEDDGGGEVVLRGNFRLHGDPGQANPLVANPGDPEGPLVRFVDEFGEVHWLRGGERLPPVASPFVPRRLVTGRALAVFWPLVPRMDIYRLKWVR